MELMAACQALEFLWPLRTTRPLCAVYDRVRTVHAPFKEDRYLQPEMEAVTKLLHKVDKKNMNYARDLEDSLGAHRGVRAGRAGGRGIE